MTSPNQPQHPENDVAAVATASDVGELHDWIVDFEEWVKPMRNVLRIFRPGDGEKVAHGDTEILDCRAQIEQSQDLRELFLTRFADCIWRARFRKAMEYAQFIADACDYFRDPKGYLAQPGHSSDDSIYKHWTSFGLKDMLSSRDPFVIPWLALTHFSYGGQARKMTAKRAWSIWQGLCHARREADQTIGKPMATGAL